jgi:hypothetical protein
MGRKRTAGSRNSVHTLSEPPRTNFKTATLTHANAGCTNVGTQVRNTWLTSLKVFLELMQSDNSRKACGA